MKILLHRLKRPENVRRIAKGLLLWMPVNYYYWADYSYQKYAHLSCNHAWIMPYNSLSIYIYMYIYTTNQSNLLVLQLQSYQYCLEKYLPCRKFLYNTFLVVQKCHYIGILHWVIQMSSYWTNAQYWGHVNTKSSTKLEYKPKTY